MQTYATNQIVAAVLAINDQLADYNVNDIADYLASHTDIDTERANTVINTINYGIGMDILRGVKIGAFITALYETLNKDVNTLRNSFGILVSTPKIYAQYLKKNQITEVAASSKYVGEIGDRLEQILTVLDSKVIRWYGGSFILTTAVDHNHNLYTFSTKTLLAEGKQLNIRAKIKDHKVDQHLNMIKVTNLNYVKVLEQ